jgi:hypothetical protein
MDENRYLAQNRSNSDTEELKQNKTNVLYFDIIKRDGSPVNEIIRMIWGIGGD